MLPRIEQTMTTLGASKAADDPARKGGRSAAFVPHFWPDHGLSRYSLGSVIATSEGSVVRFAVVAGAAQFARLLVVKQLNPVVSRQPLRVSRFREEMRIHARVRHPNVVEVLDIVESGGESWLVMEHVDGATLATLSLHHRASGRPIELVLAAAIVAPLLRGLHAVHETKDDAGLSLGLVHGGVSPRHVMMDRDGQVKLIDFGMARVVGSDALPLGLRRAPGRFGHLSPELVLGEKVDRRTDVFSAGVLLWEAIAGRPLFEESGGPDADGLRRVLRATIPDLRSIRAETPKALSAVVHKALQRDPDQRFATAQEFALALESAVAPASPSRLAALVTGLGARHFEPTRQALAAVRRLLPEPLVKGPFSMDAETEEETALVLTGRFTRTDTLSPSQADVPPSSPSVWRHIALALVAAALAASLVVGLRKQSSRPLAQTASHSLSLAADVAEGSFSAASAAPVVDSVAPISIDALPLSPPPSPNESEPVRRPRPWGGHALSNRQPRPSVIVGASLTAGCSPPTFLGEDGIRHFKEHCL